MQAEWETVEAFQRTNVLKERRESLAMKPLPDGPPLSQRSQRNEESQVDAQAEVARSEPRDALDELKVSFASLTRQHSKLDSRRTFALPWFLHPFGSALPFDTRAPGGPCSKCRHKGTSPRKSAVLPGA